MRTRLDTLLVARGLIESREKAKRLILAGAVRVDGHRAGKPSDLIDDTAQLDLVAGEKYVSRGGHKLEAALAAWDIPCADAVVIDIGASTGGFTDCMLQRGVRKVHAVDVGKGQLHWRLRRDPRVVVHDAVNARALTEQQLGQRANIVTIDVSFISLTKILPAAAALLRPSGWLVALIKPQFEAGRHEVRKGGVVREATIHQRVVADVRDFAVRQLGLLCRGVIESPLRGPAGNKEFFIGLQRA